MNRSNSKFRQAAIAIAVAAGLTTAAVAQQGPGMMGHGGPAMMMGGGRGPMFASNEADIAKFQQDRLGQLKSRLNITAEQRPAWDAFTAQAAEQAKTMQALRNDTGAATMPERMQQRQKAMGTMNEFVTKLYEVLTPKQRELFNQSHGPMYRRG